MLTPKVDALIARGAVLWREQENDPRKRENKSSYERRIEDWRTSIGDGLVGLWLRDSGAYRAILEDNDAKASRLHNTLDNLISVRRDLNRYIFQSH